MEGRSSSHVEERVYQANVHSITAWIHPMLHNVPPLLSSGYCIYRVPERLRNVKPEAYTPLIVSIGPFHHGHARLKSMEHLKTQYLHSLLRRHPQINPLHKFVQELLKLETSARNCYAETIPYTKEEFVKMLLLDGCFLLELFRQYDDPALRQDNDQLFKNRWVFNAVHHDVLLLENQIPFFFLEKLSSSTPPGPRGNSNLSDLIKVFLGHHKLTRVQSFLRSSEEDQLLLSVLKSITNGSLEKPATNKYKTTIHQAHPTTSWTFIPSATELSRVGIILRKSFSSYLFGVHFTGNGEFHIPSLVVDDRTESFLRNLIALEQTHSQTTIIKDQNQSQSNQIPTISAYVTLMDCLVNTSTDVALLRDQGILHNQLGDDEEVAQFFNKLRTGIIMNADEFYFSEVFKSVNVYYHTKWNEWRAMFIREFWSTPWRKTSLLAAIFLLLCAFVQAICSILQV